MALLGRNRTSEVRIRLAERSTMREQIDRILREVSGALQQADEVQFDSLCEAVLAAQRVFVTGQGRSGYVARAFAMRLMHLGLDARFTGGTTTPPIGIDDLLVAVSGSGERQVTCSYLKTAKEAGAGSAVITISRHATSARLAAFTVVLGEDIESGQVGGSLFEQASFLYLEAVAAALGARLGETHESMMARHANLE